MILVKLAFIHKSHKTTKGKLHETALSYFLFFYPMNACKWVAELSVQMSLKYLLSEVIKLHIYDSTKASIIGTT